MAAASWATLPDGPGRLSSGRARPRLERRSTLPPSLMRPLLSAGGTSSLGGGAEESPDAPDEDGGQCGMTASKTTLPVTKSDTDLEISWELQRQHLKGSDRLHLLRERWAHGEDCTPSTNSHHSHHLKRRATVYERSQSGLGTTSSQPSSQRRQSWKSQQDYSTPGLRRMGTATWSEPASGPPVTRKWSFDQGTNRVRRGTWLMLSGWIHYEEDCEEASVEELFWWQEWSLHKLASVFEFCTLGLVTVSVSIDFVDSMPSNALKADAIWWFYPLEVTTAIVFAAEYILRVWSCAESIHYHFHWLQGRLWFMVQFMSLVDLVVLLAVIIDICLGSDRTRGLQALRGLRHLRVLSILKRERHLRAASLVHQVISRKQKQLSVSLFVAITLLVMGSVSMYYIENPIQPDQFSSIPATMWWTVTVMTTVGYGDIVPMSILGRVLSAAVSAIGVGLFALPSGVLAQGFMEIFEEHCQAESDALADLLDEAAESGAQLREEMAGLTAEVARLQQLLQKNDDSVKKLVKKKQMPRKKKSPSASPRNSSQRTRLSLDAALADGGKAGAVGADDYVVASSPSRRAIRLTARKATHPSSGPDGSLKSY